MRRSLALVAGLAVALALTVGASTAATPSVQIAQVDTSRYPLITATVIAPGSDKLPQVSLSASENGVPVTTTQSGGGSAAAIGVALDVSRSTEGAPLAASKEAALAFVKAKRTSDSMALYAFGHTANPVHALDTDVDALATAMTQLDLDPIEGTALYDSVVQASRELGAAPTLTKVLVVLTDGADDNSTRTTLAKAIAAAKAAGVTVDAIAVGDGNHPELTSLARQTGGRVFSADQSASGISAVYRQIASEIRNTYRLQYTSQADGVVPLEVSLKGYTPATQNIDVTAPAAEIVAAGGTISSISKRSSTGLALALVIGLLVLGLVLLMVRQPRETILARRLERYTAGERGPAITRERGLSLRNLLVLRGERSFGGSSYFKHVAGVLERADVPMRAAEFVAIQVGAALVLLLFGLFVGLGPLFSLILLIVGALIPEVYMRRKANSRRRKFEDQLGDTLGAVASSLRAGQSFQQAMSTIALDGPEPMAKEFQRVETETRLGRPADEALQSMAERLASKNFEFVVLAVNIQRQVGGSLSEILDMVSDTVRGRVQFARKVKALTAMGRASAYVLVGMPFFLAGMIFLVDRSYIRPLWAESAGHIMIVIGLISMSLGALACRKIVNFKY
jgi:tight adherence protein B